MAGRRRFSLRISRPLKKEVARRAQADGVSINAWIHMAIARRAGGEATAEAFFQHLRESSDPSAMLTLLKQSQED
ncbi:toxin-antitoxin system HicB family antitoxin [Hyphomonas sp.]|jgi:uncharacterized membrane-anchored protein|uniref:toxin-antitoxin system HicB family antitoxin n=1 Tax=Hyphomonas sp. TaxID=87 RepID=UPI000C5CB450|nr:toxin-antitoxin system HicB family antitoxin [Hyphomonas sp.]MAU68150.1 hypothetical protein [Hyphomonas sp.]